MMLPSHAHAVLPSVLAQEQSGAPSLWIILLGTLAIFWFVAILPERKERKRKQQMIEELQKNDRILMTSGMYATVAALGDQDLTVKFDEGPTRVKVLKSSIATVVRPDAD